MAKSAFTASFSPTLLNHEGALQGLEPMGGIKKDLCGAKLLPTTVSACAVNCSEFCHLVKTQHCCLCPCEKYNPPLAVHPLPPTHPLLCAICDITVKLLKIQYF